MGDQGTILRGDGSAWLPIARATTSTFNGVWGSGPSDVWAIEFPGTLRHWNGSAWLTDRHADERLSAIWGAGPNDVWVVGDSATILRWDGRVWSTPQLPATIGSRPLAGIWGTSDHDVWAVGGAGTIVHWDGSAWLAFPGDTAMSLNGVWGSGPSDVWAVGVAGAIVHFDGLAWHSVQSGISDCTCLCGSPRCSSMTSQCRSAGGAVYQTLYSP